MSKDKETETKTEQSKETKFSDMVSSETMKKINKEIRDGTLVVKKD